MSRVTAVAHITHVKTLYGSAIPGQKSGYAVHSLLCTQAFKVCSAVTLDAVCTCKRTARYDLIRAAVFTYACVYSGDIEQWTAHGHGLHYCVTGEASTGLCCERGVIGNGRAVSDACMLILTTSPLEHLTSVLRRTVTGADW